MRPTRCAVLAWGFPLGSALVLAGRPAGVAAQGVTAQTAGRAMRPHTPAAAYRVSVYSADWTKQGGL